MAYTDIDDPSKHFQSVIWTGNGASDTRTISFDGNSDMQPDWVWHKQRNDTYGNHVFDSSRGFGANKELITRGNFVEGDTSNFNTGANGYVSAAASDGFVVKKGTNSSNGNRYINESNDTHVAWCWKANGGTTTTNDASSTSVGTIDSVIQANTEAGFSIVTYTGNATDNAQFAHGLGATPEWILIKNRDTNVDWTMGHTDFMGSSAENIRWNGSSAVASASSAAGSHFSRNAPSSTVVTLGNGAGGDFSTDTNQADAHVAYCFRSVQGYSKIGTYVGNGNADGTFIYTGFKIAWLITRKSTGNNWIIMDNKVSPNNPSSIYARSDTAEAEGTSGLDIDMLSNGFKIRTTSAAANSNNVKYYFMAFAEHPFVSSKGVPTTAR